MKRERSWATGLVLGGSLLAASGLTALPGFAKEAPPKAAPPSSSRLWIDGDSTLHSFKSSATDWSVQAALKSGSGPLNGAGALRRAVLSGKMISLEASVSVKGMRSGERGLDHNMAKALKGSKNPRVTFKMESYRVLSSSTPKANTLALSVQGELSIAGQTNPVELKAAASFSGSSMRVTGLQKIFMSDYGIKPPTLFMGAIRVANRVMVGYELDLTCKPDGSCVKS